MDAAAEGSSEVANTLMLLPHNLQLIVQPTGAKTCERKIHARCLINTSTVFGPLIAPRRPITLRPASPPASVLPLLTAADLSLIESFDVSSNATCNWMKFVRFAMRDGLANMEAVQRRGQLFFHVTRDIPRGDELIVALSPSLIAVLEKSAANIWSQGMQELDESTSGSIDRDYSHVHLGMLVQRVVDVLRLTSSTQDVLRDRVLQLDYTAAIFLRRLMESQMDPATWPPLNVYMKRVLDRLTKWMALPVGLRSAQLSSSNANSYPEAIPLSATASLFLLSPMCSLKDLTVPLFLEPVLQPIFPQWSVPLVGIQVAAPAAPIPLSQSAFAPARVLSRSSDAISSKQLQYTACVDDIGSDEFGLFSSEVNGAASTSAISLEGGATFGESTKVVLSLEDVLSAEEEGGPHTTAFLKYMAECEELFNSTYGNDESGESLSTKADWMEEQRQSYAQLWLEHQRKCMPTLVDSVPEKVNPIFPSPMSDVLPLDDDGVDGKISTGRVEDLVKPMSEREVRRQRRNTLKEDAERRKANKWARKAGHSKTAIPGAAFFCQGVEAIGSHSDIFSELDEEGGQGLEELEEPKRKWKNTKYFKQLNLTESNKPLADSFQPAPPGLDEDVEVGEFGPIPRDFTDGVGKPKKIAGRVRKSSTKELLFQCRCCDVCCATKTKLKRHITAEHGRKSKELRIQCRHCAMRCATKSQLRRHTAAEHGTKISSIKWCRICFESFETVAATKEHFESHRNDEGKLPCSLCEDAFTRYETLTRHRALKHEQAGEIQPQLLRKRPKGKAFGDPVTATSTKETAVNGDRIDEDNLRCQLCGERTVFENSEALLSHMRTEHAYEFLGRQAEKTTTEVRPHRCSVCSKDFQYAGTLALHFKAIHSDLPYTNCRICKEECRTFQVFKAHMKGHYVDGRLPCTHCPSTFATIVQFTKHVRANHLKRPRPPPCNICGVQLNSITCARQHKQLAHGIGEAIRGCRLCGALKKNPQSLAQHFRNHHPNESPGYRPRGDNTFKVTCTHCSGVFSNDATLERHHKDQHWKVLGLPMPRVRAVRAQPGEKECLSGPCTVCGKKFNVTGTSNGLCLRREHMQSQHGIGNYRNFYCAICGKWFKLVPLRKHFAREHPGEEPRFRDPSDNSMKRVCAFCPGVFFNKNLLERHQRKDHAKEMARGAGVLEDNGESDEEELSPDEDNLADDASQTESDSDED